MRSLADCLRELHEAGIEISIDADNRLDIDFGDREVPDSLLSSLRHHADDLRILLPRLSPPAVADSSPIPITVGKVSVPFELWTPFDEPLGSVVGFDSETTVVDLDDAELYPEVVVASATDGKRGYLIRPEDVAAFFEAHPKTTLAMHNAPFDIEAVARISRAASEAVDRLVDENRVVDTQELERLLILAREAGTPPDRVSLASLGERYLGESIEKATPDIDGTPIRLAFGKYLGRSPLDMPIAFREYAGGDALATLLVYRRQTIEVGRIRRDVAPTAFGFTTDDRLREAWEKYGDLSLAVQVRAAIIARRLWRAGVDIDPDRCRRLREELTRAKEEVADRLRAAGLFVPREGERKPKDEPALLTAIRDRVETAEGELLAAGKLSAPFERTPTGRISVDAEQQQHLADATGDATVAEFVRHETLGRFLKFVEKIDRPRIHPQYRSLKASGRFSCEKPNVQQLPKCGRDTLGLSLSIRQALVPPPGHVFAIVDFHQLEARSLAAAWKYQLDFGDSLAQVVEAGVDIHTAIARELHGREPTKAERSRVKPITFGYPAGMGAEAIIRNAKTVGVELTREQVDATIAAYRRMAPELDKHLARSTDVGQLCRRFLGLESKGAGWKVLHLLAGEHHELDDDTADALWSKAQAFASIVPTKSASDRKLLEHLAQRKPSRALAGMVRKALSAEAVLTMSGRIRGSASFTESRNGVFQGNAADGAILAVYALLRAGFDVRLFVHDEAVVVIPDDADRDRRLEEIGRVMCDTMSEALGGMPTKVEGITSRSWSTFDKIETPPAPTPEPAKPGKKSLLRGTVQGYAPRKKAEAVDKSSPRTWAQKVESGDFDNGDLPF